ncbi:MAG: hypothetical protein AAGG01_23985, partial [Planctomycetota bacterium]
MTSRLITAAAAVLLIIPLGLAASTPLGQSLPGDPQEGQAIDASSDRLQVESLEGPSEGFAAR